jgi:hypothetical protein
LEEQLSKEREQRRCAAEDAEQYRRFAQKLYATLHPPTQADIDWWRNVKLADQTVSLQDVLAEIENTPK